MDLLKGSLKEALLFSNRLSSITSFGSPGAGLLACDRLIFVDLHANALEELPKEFGASLPHLREINLSQNRFAAIPPTLYECERLEIIDASRNRIETLSAGDDALGRLRNLGTLDLSNNASKFPIRK